MTQQHECTQGSANTNKQLNKHYRWLNSQTFLGVPLIDLFHLQIPLSIPSLSHTFIYSLFFFQLICFCMCLVVKIYRRVMQNRSFAQPVCCHPNQMMPPLHFGSAAMGEQCPAKQMEMYDDVQIWKYHWWITFIKL